MRMQLYMRDLVEGVTTLVADEPVPGLSWSGAPDRSHDGTRIVFDTSPGKDFVRSRLMIMEARDGKSVVRNLGAGNSAVEVLARRSAGRVLAQSGAVSGGRVGGSTIARWMRRIAAASAAPAPRRFGLTRPAHPDQRFRRSHRLRSLYGPDAGNDADLGPWP